MGYVLASLEQSYLHNQLLFLLLHFGRHRPGCSKRMGKDVKFKPLFIKPNILITCL